jgi:phosphate/sulfate permease
MIEATGILLATGVALNIGANNTGIAMGPLTGAGLRGRRSALLLAALFNVLGACLVGARGVAHVGGILLGGEMGLHPAVFLLAAPAVTLALLGLANLLRVPVSTTHAAMAALLGVGLVTDVLRLPHAASMAAWWLATPAAAIASTWAAGRAIRSWRPGLFGATPGRWAGPLLTAAACYVAFTVGANNAANATAVLYGTGLLGAAPAALVAGLGMAAGALLWGGGTLAVVGEGIAELCPVRSLVVASVSGSITLAAAWGGIPVSKTLVVAGGVIGFSLASSGIRATAGNVHVRRILALWTASPLVAAGFTYALGALARR